MSNPKSLFEKVLSGSLMITGTTVGAGMLGIPLVTWQSGFVPALLVTAGVWLFMLATGLLLTKTALKMEKGTSFYSLSEELLGKKGKWMVGPLFLFLYVSLLVAYFAAGAPFVGLLFSGSSSSWVQNLLFGVFFGIIVYKGNRSIDRANIILTLLMFGAYAVLISLGISSVKPEFLVDTHFSKAWIACPILFSAFGFHNVIPSLTSYLNKDKKALYLSLFIGTFIPFVIYALWQWLILGSVPISALAETLLQGNPATYALATATKKSTIFPLGQTFAFLAIVTSLLGVSFSLIDFLKDSFEKTRFGKNRFYLTLFTFFPPFLLASINPAIFDEALGVAGGIGESLLNGIIPVVLFMKAKERFKERFKEHALFQKPFLALLILIALSVLFMEIKLLFL